MGIWLWIFILTATSLAAAMLIWSKRNRRYESSDSVASAYDSWTNDQLLERLWGDHVHL
ncbi:MAG: SAM-dependent methyltransferase, partial [Prochlorococcus sp.]